jgi:hypothetical protein
MRKLDDIPLADNKRRSIIYYKDYSIDNVGNVVISGETGIAEGWPVPKLN